MSQYSMHVDTGRSSGQMTQYMVKIEADSAREAMERCLYDIDPAAESASIEILEVLADE